VVVVVVSVVGVNACPISYGTISEIIVSTFAVYKGGQRWLKFFLDLLSLDLTWVQWAG